MKVIISVLGIVVLVGLLIVLRSPPTPFGPEIDKRDAEVIEWLIRDIQLPDRYNDRANFLTVSKWKNWMESENWKSFPESFHKRIEDFPIKFQPASSAQRVNGVICNGVNGKPARMWWVAIHDWESETQVVIETGFTNGSPEATTGGIYFVERIKGDWKFTATLDKW